MTPITDDIVYSLMEGFEARTNSRPRTVVENGETARILDFVTRQRISASGRIISLDVARARRTVSGLFCYATRS